MLYVWKFRKDIGDRMWLYMPWFSSPTKLSSSDKKNTLPSMPLACFTVEIKPEFITAIPWPPKMNLFPMCIASAVHLGWLTISRAPDPFTFPGAFTNSSLLCLFLPMSRSHLKAMDIAALPLHYADLLSAFNTTPFCMLCLYPVYLSGVTELNLFYIFRLSQILLSLGLKGAKYHLQWWSVVEK